ncbi:MAG: Ger(x)C family spore germination protein [Ethanoligenens sp.]
MIITVLFSGCAPHKELKELSIVKGMGVDLNPNGSYLLTFQIFNPKSGGGGGGGTQTSGSSSQSTIIQGSGKSLFDATRNVTMQMGKQLYYSNVSSLIFGKEICSGKLPELFDFFERNHEIMPSERVFMAENRAEDILMAQNVDGYISAHDIELIAENNMNTSEVVDQQLKDILKVKNTGMQDFYMGILSMQQNNTSNGQQPSQSSGNGGGGSGGSNDTIIEAGTAIFHNSKQAGILDDSQTRGLLWILGEVHGGLIVVDLKEGGNVSLEIKQAGSSVSMSEKDGKPCADINIHLESSIGEIESTNINDYNDTIKDELISLQNQAVKKEAESAVNIALKKDHSDVFGFGLKLFEFQPAVWHKLNKSWYNDAEMIPVNINVSSTIRHNGLISK